MRPTRGFIRFAWTVLVYDVAVIAWGALVRATGSGAGCGYHWPTCNGQVVPRSPRLETLVEFTHRATSGVALLLVVALVLWARRALPRGHAARKAAAFSLVFTVSEALLGAGLVLFGWVAQDASAGRGWAMSLHLLNTFLLLASLALTVAWSAPPSGAGWSPSGVGLRVLVAVGMAAMLLAGVTGAIAALGDTLFPSTSFAEGLAQDLGGGAHVLLRLRVFHPVAATLAAVLLLGIAYVATAARGQRAVQRVAAVLVTVASLQLIAGLVNLLLLAPVWLQLVHLVLADVAWIALVVLAAWTVGAGEAAGATGPAAEPAAQRG